MTPDTAKVKCKNFLSTLLRLASEQPESVATNVQSLIQGLVDAKVEPEEFTTKLQRELNSSPQPCLIPFLKVAQRKCLFEDRNFSFALNFLLLTEKFAVLEAIFSRS
jgi:transcription initiation factor TFIID subunit 4